MTDMSETSEPTPGPARRWLLIGAPMEGSGKRRGEVKAPSALRAAGLVEGLDAVDFGDLPVVISDSSRDPSTGVIGYGQLVAGSGLIADAVSSALHAGWKPLLVGGCCSVLPGALAGASRYAGPVRMIFVDGHLDLFTPRNTRTGELAGMALAVVTGHDCEELKAVAGNAPLVEPRDLFIIGDADGSRRAASGAEEAATAIPDARVFDARSTTSLGADVVANRVAALAGGDAAQPCWLHLDVDVLDGSVMPAVSFPVTGGIDWDDLESLITIIGRSVKLLGVSLAGLNVDLDARLESSRRLARILATALR